MKYSQMFIPTVKEVPADAEVISHRLMIRAGMIRKVASGTYTYLPLGQRSLLKITAIVREEMNRTGAQEILVPSLQPRELWDRTGRSADYGPTMFSLEDRHGRLSVLSPTAEEVVTSLAAGEINSYKQLPINLYQISPKFRDEFRPRFGTIRSREFIMKDAYSFHDTAESLQQTYQAMYDAYCRVFQRSGVNYVIVEAETGEMGGSGSHQFTVPCESGEDVIVYTEDGSYAANIERAGVDPLARTAPPADVPAIVEIHTPDVGTIEAVCGFLSTKPRQMIKTLIYTVGDQEKTVAVLVRGDHEVNAEKLAQHFPGEHIELAQASVTEKCSGAAVGFAGPVALAEKVAKCLIDHAVAAMPKGFAGANKTDYHIKNVVPGRDFSLEGGNVLVTDMRNARDGDTYQGQKLLFKRGIEVGQVFKLGTKYSSKLDASYLDEQGQQNPCLMGCYGIGINRILASAVELGHDDNGIIWPISIAPFEVLITAVNPDDEAIDGVSQQIYQELQKLGVEVLLDDRALRAGVKFKDADLIGIPIRITIGKRSVAQGNVEIKLRRESEGLTIGITEAAHKALELVKALKAELQVEGT
jgi:prolyl-tRNA synthetase